MIEEVKMVEMVQEEVRQYAGSPGFVDSYTVFHAVLNRIEEDMLSLGVVYYDNPEEKWKLEVRLKNITKQVVTAENERRIQIRKEYGRRINAIMKENGLGKEAITSYWDLKWRKEVTAEDWVQYVSETDEDSIRAGLCASNRSFLIKCGLEWILEKRGSFPRTMDILKGLARAKGLEPMDPGELRKFLEKVVDFSEESFHII